MNNSNNASTANASSNAGAEKPSGLFLALLMGLSSGLLFGFGLAISGITDTEKVLGFLDFAGASDPTLIFVMGGALLVTVPVYQLVKKRDRSFFSGRFHLPNMTSLDKRLIGGAVLFGAGWGIFGYCPGLAISSLTYGYQSTVIFVISMVIGMWLAGSLFKLSKQ